MTNNEIFKNLLFLTGLNRDQDRIIEIYSLAGNDDVSRSKIKGWRTSDEDSRDFVRMSDSAIADFVQGLYKYKEMKKAQGITVFNFEVPAISDKS